MQTAATPGRRTEARAVPLRVATLLSAACRHPDRSRAPAHSAAAWAAVAVHSPVPARMAAAARPAAVTVATAATAARAAQAFRPAASVAQAAQAVRVAAPPARQA